MPTPMPYLLVEPVLIVDVSSSEEDPKEDLEELPLEPVVDAPDTPEDDEAVLPDADFAEDVIPAPEAHSTEESGPGGTVDSDDSSSHQTAP